MTNPIAVDQTALILKSRYGTPTQQEVARFLLQTLPLVDGHTIASQDIQKSRLPAFDSWLSGHDASLSELDEISRAALIEKLRKAYTQQLLKEALQ